MTPNASGGQDNRPRTNNLAHINRDRGYRFVDRDPVMQQVTDAITTSGRSLAWISQRSGVSEGTLQNWMNGTTRRPQHLTVTFVMQALGFRHVFVDLKQQLPEEKADALEPVTVDDVYFDLKPRIRDQFLGRIPAIRAKRAQREAERAQRRA